MTYQHDYLVTGYDSPSEVLLNAVKAFKAKNENNSAILLKAQDRYGHLVKESMKTLLESKHIERDVSRFVNDQNLFRSLMETFGKI